MAVDVTLLNSNSIMNIEENFERIEQALQDTVSRSGNLPNHMDGDLDMNNNDILNIRSIEVESLIVDGEVVTPNVEFFIPADDSVSTVKIQNNAVTTNKLEDNSVTNAKMADNAIGTAEIQNASVTLAKLGPDVILSDTTIADPMNYGAVGDGVANDTVAVQAALDSGRSIVRINNTFSCSALTIPTTVKIIEGPGTVKQRALGTNLFSVTDSTQLTIRNLNILGAASLGTATAASSNDGITLTDCSNVHIENCTISRFLFRPIIAKGTDNLTVTNNYFVENAVGPRFMGCKKVFITDNLIDGKCLVDAEFTTGIGLESTDGNSYPVCEDVVISGNTTKNLVNCQGVLVHGGKRVSVINNIFLNCTIAISFNPYNTVDYITYPTIMGNIIESYDGAWSFGSGTGGSAIVVQAGPASGGGDTPTIIGARIVGNMVLSGNRSKGGSNEGGIQISYANETVISGNVIQASKGAAIVALQCRRLLMNSNTISTVLLGASSQQDGIRILAGCDGTAQTNMFYAMTNGIVRTASPAFQNANNVYDGVTNVVVT